MKKQVQKKASFQYHRCMYVCMYVLYVCMYVYMCNLSYVCKRVLVWLG